MSKNKAAIYIAGALAVAAAIICWLMFGGSAPKNVDVGDGVSAQLNASLKNSVISREKDGQKLWEFTVEEIINDKAKGSAVLKGVQGKVFRSDGSYLDIKAGGGSAAIDGNDFSLDGGVEAVLSSGGKLIADKVSWQQKSDTITAQGKVKLYKDEWFASADEAKTTSAFEKLKLKGHAKVEKGGDEQ